MKRSLKTIALTFIFVIGVFALTGCGNSSKGTETTGAIIKANIPNGWILKAGKDIDTVGYVDDADYIIKANSVDTSAPTLQVSLANQSNTDIDAWKGWIDGGSYGTANEPFEVNGITWYTAKEGGVALINGKVCLVFNLNGASFTDKSIQEILGSISWVE